MMKRIKVYFEADWDDLCPLCALCGQPLAGADTHLAAHWCPQPTATFGGYTGGARTHAESDKGSRFSREKPT